MCMYTRVRPHVCVRTWIGHDYPGHNYIGHNYIGHGYIGPSYTGHDYVVCERVYTLVCVCVHIRLHIYGHVCEHVRAVIQ